MGSPSLICVSNGTFKWNSDSPQGPTLPWVLGGLDDHANMFLEREDEAREEWQARPVLESKWASVRTTWVLVRVEAVSEHTPDPWITEDILTRSFPQSHVHVNDTVQMRNGDREGKVLGGGHRVAQLNWLAGQPLQRVWATLGSSPSPVPASLPRVWTDGSTRV